MMRPTALLVTGILLAALLPVAAEEAADVHVPPLSGTQSFHEDPVMEATNFDGTIWRIHYGTFTAGVNFSSVDVEGIARALLGAAVFVYQTEVVRNRASCDNGMDNPSPNWGFEANDSDCVLEIHLFNPGTSGPVSDRVEALGCTACAAQSDAVVIRVQPWFRQSAMAVGHNLDPQIHDRDAMARVVMAHELFHNLQYVVSHHTPDWRTYVEGQAAFVETLAGPEQSEHATSSWYSRANGYQRTAASGLCQTDHVGGTGTGQGTRTYESGLYWAYLYANDGGMGTIRSVLENVTGAPSGSSCDTGLPQVITTVLANGTGPHFSHEEALVAFALDAYTKQNLTWGTPWGTNVTDWGHNLSAPFFHVQTAGSIDRTVGPSGIQYVKLPPAGTYGVDCTAGGGWTFRLFLNATGTVTTQAVTCGTPVNVNGGAYSEVIFSAVRTTTSQGTYRLTVT